MSVENVASTTLQVVSATLVIGKENIELGIKEGMTPNKMIVMPVTMSISRLWEFAFL